MLINLSSLNEPDPAKFKNDFSDSMMIPLVFSITPSN